MRSPIVTANSVVSIAFVCGLIGVYVPSDVGEGRSLKVYCPFGSVYHADGGQEAALRIYPDTNSAWCFDEREYYTPTKLYAVYSDVDQETAALELLDRVGHSSLDVVKEWDRVNTQTAAVSQDSLSEALKVYCGRIDPSWESHQFDPVMASTLTLCLALLPRVRTAPEAEQWLSVSKLVMKNLIEREIGTC